MPGKAYCSGHLTAGQRRERRARDEAEAARLQVAAKSPLLKGITDGDFRNGAEMLAALAAAKLKEINELRALAHDDAEEQEDGGYGLRVTSAYVKESATTGRERKKTYSSSQSIYLNKLWEAERDLVKILAATTNIDTNEALIKAQVRSRREYANDLREAIAAARSFPEMTDDDVLLYIVREAKRARDAE